MDITIGLRYIIKLDKSNEILTVMNIDIERFNKMDYYKEYVENIKSGLDLKWIDVYNYSSKIKFSEEIKLEEDTILDYLEKINSSKDNIEIAKLKEALDLNEILQHEDYFNTIKDLESKLTNIVLTDDESNMIQKTLESSLLDGLIKKHGFQLYIERNI